MVEKSKRKKQKLGEQSCWDVKGKSRRGKTYKARTKDKIKNEKKTQRLDETFLRFGSVFHFMMEREGDRRENVVCYWAYIPLNLITTGLVSHAGWEYTIFSDTFVAKKCIVAALLNFVFILLNLNETIPSSAFSQVHLKKVICFGIGENVSQKIRANPSVLPDFSKVLSRKPDSTVYFSNKKYNTSGSTTTTTTTAFRTIS